MRSWLFGMTLFGLGGFVGVNARDWWYSPRLPLGMESRWEATVYLPAPLAGDARLDEDDWKAAITEFTRPFGGATLTTNVEGIWHAENGSLQREVVRPVIVSFPTERLAEFRERLKSLREKLHQDALYIRYERPLIELHGR